MPRRSPAPQHSAELRRMAGRLRAASAGWLAIAKGRCTIAVSMIDYMTLQILYSRQQAAYRSKFHFRAISTDSQQYANSAPLTRFTLL